MVAGLKGQAKSDKHVKDQKWTNHYGERVPLPSLDWAIIYASFRI